MESDGKSMEQSGHPGQWLQVATFAERILKLWIQQSAGNVFLLVVRHAALYLYASTSNTVGTNNRKS